jgi:hypothetical protein
MKIVQGVSKAFPDAKRLIPGGRIRFLVFKAMLFMALPGFCLIGFAQGTAFTYQGRLGKDGIPASGSYDLRLTIFDSLSGGSAVSGSLTNSVVLDTNGLFTVLLDFGAGVFTGPDRWLQIEVRTNGAPSFTALTPRQILTPSPYAIAARSMTGVLQDTNLPANVPRLDQSNNYIGTFVGDGSGLTNLPGSGSGSGSAIAQLNGSGTNTSLLNPFLSGSLTEAQTKSVISNSAMGLDFSNAQLADLTCYTAGPIYFYTTNKTGSSTYYQRRVFLIRAGGLTVTLNYPSWSTVVAPLPTSIVPGQMLRLELESVGPGETNVNVLASQLLADGSFSFDLDASHYLAATGINDGRATNIHLFVRSLKNGSNPWGRLDALYIFPGDSAAVDSVNLISSNYYMAWAGNVTHSKTSGITGDGTTGYGVTGWMSYPGTTNASFFIWLKAFSTNDNHYALGAYNGASIGGLKRNGIVNAGMNEHLSDLAAGAISDSFPDGIMASRASSGAYHIFAGYGSDYTVSASASAPSGLSWTVLALNTGSGVVTSFWEQTVQVVALGSSFTQAQYQQLYSAVTNLNVSLGR